LDNLRVVLVSTRNPLNIGAVARAMSNFGFSKLRVVNPYDPSFREAKSAVGAAPLVASAEEFSSVADAVADCTLVVGTTAAHNRELQHPLYLLNEAAPKIQSELVSGQVALLFGSEKRGLSNHDLSHCHWLLKIPTRDEHSSMNLGQAVAVCLYALATPHVPKEGRYGAPEVQGAPGLDLDLITSTLLEALKISGYLKPRAGAATEEKIRRLVRRLGLSSDDAETWLGMLRQVIWKMKSGK
jgi:TrmH family RNA methyltransferase